MTVWATVNTVLVPCSNEWLQPDISVGNPEKGFTITAEIDALLNEVAKGSRRALSRALTAVEDSDPAMLAAIDQLQINSTPWTIAIAGPPGAGKSTLISTWLSSHKLPSPVAVLATDPSSPYSGGALLGDRTRFSGSLPDSVFYRSLASRGVRGGISSAGRRAQRLLALAGFQTLIYETVGLGQNILDVEAVAETIALILVPEAGDDLQAMKSGILEMADIIVINKSDRPGAEAFTDQVESASSHRENHRDPEWAKPVVNVIATNQASLTPYIEAVKNHRARLVTTDLPAARHRRQTALIEEALDRFRQHVETSAEQDLDQLESLIREGQLDRMIRDLFNQ